MKKQKETQKNRIKEHVWVKISDLKFAEYNPRKLSEKQHEDIQKSLTEFGFVDPIIVNKNKDRENVIIGGHQRVKVWGAMGESEVPVIYLDLILDKERELNIRLNKNTGEWDWEILQAEFEIPELLDWGFEEVDFKLDDSEGGESEGEDDIPDPLALKSSETVRGDLYELGEHRLFCGDSTVSTDVDKLMGSDNPLLMVTDPPYGVEYDPEWREEFGIVFDKRSNGKVKNDDKVDWSEAYSLFKGNVAYVWHAGRLTYTIAQNLIDCGFEIISQIIWVKQHFAMSRGDYHWQHEPCWYAVKKGEKHNWQGRRDQATTWQIKNNNSFGNSDKEETYGHGTQKPLKCMEIPILNNTERGDTVYDPFAGSGTTLIACQKHKRVCRTIELDERYCDAIVLRYVDYCKKNNIQPTVKRNGETITDFTKYGLVEAEKK